MFIVVPAVLIAIPVTALVELEVSVSIVFEKILSLPAVVAIPVTAAVLEILLIKLPVVELLVPELFTEIAVIVPELPIQLLNILF